MIKRLKTPIPLMILSILMVSFVPALATDCPDFIESGCDGGWAWFGLRHDGAVLAQGQTVTLECDSAVLSMEYMFRITGNPNGDVPSMVAGDEIHLALMDTEFNTYYTVTTAVPADVFTGWLAFDFPEGFIVPAGQYLFAAYTEVDRQCSFGFCYGGNDDTYEGGTRRVSSNGIEGPWPEYSNGNDVPFRLYLEEGTVDTVESAWGGVKGLYR